jgi:dipeptidyl aminopeptidase/acylaminoacyl peptidase
MISPSLRPCLLLTAAALALLSSALAGPPPASDFVRRLDVSNVQISEDGHYVSFQSPGKDDSYDLNLYDTETRKPMRLDLGGMQLATHQWIDAHRMILSYLNDTKQVYDARLNKVTGNISAFGQFLVFISALRKNPDLFIVRFYEEYLNSGARSGLAVINSQRVTFSMAGHNNLRFNVRDWLDLPPGQLNQTLTDADGEVRGVSMYYSGKLRFHYRTSAQAPWTELPLDLDRTTVREITSNPDILSVSHFAENVAASRLQTYQISTGQFGPVIVEDAEYSLDEATTISIRQSDGASRPVGVTYQRSLPTQKSLDPAFSEVQDMIALKLPGRLNLIEGCDSNLRRFIISSASGREPPRYAIYDRESLELLPLPAPAPWLKSEQMSVKQPVRFTTRDGLVLEGYLSMPVGTAPGSKPSLIVFPHGGPWARDIWSFDSRVQFLTSRGYAVFQPNYRGSTGYPKKVSIDPSFDFMAMHHDVTDGVRHIIAQGLVNETKIAIFGGSFGGYLAVCGAAFEPDLYRCAATFAGVFDWKMLVDSRNAYKRYDRYQYDRLIQKLGDPDKQQARFEAISPINRVAAIKIPLLVAHGKLDLTVEFAQSTRLLAELKKHNITHEKLMFDTEAHGLEERKNAQKFLETLESFLARNL